MTDSRTDRRRRRGLGRAGRSVTMTCATTATAMAMATAIAVTGCGSAGPGTNSGTGQAVSRPCAVRPASQARPGPEVSGPAWPERRTRASAGFTQNYSGLVVDPPAGTAYALVRQPAAPGHGRYRLRCLALASGLTSNGPDLRTPDLALASGFLWASGQPGRAAELLQIDPRTLHVIRSIRLPGTAAPGYAPLRVTAGPGRSVWAGSATAGSAATVFRLNTGTGAILATARLPAGTAAYDLATDPARAVLYAAAAHIVGGGPEGNLVLEYDARSGRQLAVADHGLVSDAVAGSTLTAVPGSVWDSFRTGMLGLTLHLRQAGLALTAPTGPGVTGSPANGLFHWAMYASTIYNDGSLWLTNQAGILACLNPATGRPRAAERLSPDKLVFQLFAADPARHRLYAADGHGFLVIAPPAACWTS